MSNSKMYDPSKYSVTDGITLAKDLIRTKNPYEIITTFEGDKVVIFSEHFIEAYREALSFNCTANMTRKELSLYAGYIEFTKYQSESDVMELDTDLNLVYRFLDKWTIDELADIEHVDYKKCQ